LSIAEVAVSQSALRDYLVRKKVLCPEKNRLPVQGKLPQCARTADVEAFVSSNIGGPDIDNPLYNWSASLITCGWNKALTNALAKDYLGKLQAGRIKHNHVVVSDAGVSEGKLCKLIPTRLERTQRHWRDAERRRQAQEDPFVPSAPQLAAADVAKREMRRCNRSRKVS